MIFFWVYRGIAYPDVLATIGSIRQLKLPAT